MYTLTQFIYDNFDNRKYVCCVYIEWRRDYLQNRQQCVKVEDNVSNLRDITCGVPQGSTLGPLFFIMYMNDIICSFGETESDFMQMTL